VHPLLFQDLKAPDGDSKPLRPLEMVDAPINSPARKT
jgi:hypothetical protein